LYVVLLVNGINIMLTDHFGNEFKVGDFVIWAVTQYRSTALRKGIVTALTNKEGQPAVRVDIFETKWDWIEQEHLPSIRKGSISTPSHAVILQRNNHNAKTMTDVDWKVTYQDQLNVKNP